MGKACWTCKKRKIRCDLRTPTCLNCTNVGTICEYGIQLSWPRHGDARRSILLQDQRFVQSRNTSSPHFVGVGSSDIVLHHLLSSRKEKFDNSGLVSKWPLMDLCKPERIPQELLWIPLDGGTFDITLISHFENIVATMLTSLDDARFKRLLLSMSFTDDSPSSVAVRQALYGLTALNLYGFGERAVQFRANAVRALDVSQSNCSVKDRLQQMAAALLLSLFEMYDCSDIQYDWMKYTAVAKRAGKQVFYADQSYEGDTCILLNWLYYHDALLKFSTRHWARTTPCMEGCVKDDQIRQAVLCGNSSKIISTVGCSVEVLDAIASICNYALPKQYNPENDCVEDIEAIERLERRLIYAKQHIPIEEEPERSTQDDAATKIAELYRLSGLVYLYRACKGVPSTSPKVKTAVHAGLSIFTDLRICDRAFPLVILGFEARCDEDRQVVLDLLHRTRSRHKLGNLSLAQRFIEASWAQDDLDPDETLNYVQKLNGVMTMNEHLPCFS